MNERIQELLLKASEYALTMNPEEDSYGHPANLGKYHLDRDTKFAELLVKECLAKAEEEAELYRGFSHLGGAEYAKVMYNYQLLLKEHFGVEE